VRRLWALLLLAGLSLEARAVVAQDKGSDKAEPAVSGTTQGNVGCVILERGTPVKKKLLFAGVIYARTEYRVLETFNYRMETQKFTGPGEIKQLNERAQKDKIKLVVLPSKHTNEQLAEARKLCQE
jgi:hypothetical protein